LWFNTTLIDGVGFSNAPSQPDTIYGKAFFPLSNPVDLAPWDTITVQLKANLVGDDYIWSWNTKVLGQGNPTDIKADFHQSTFLGTPLSPNQLRKLSDRFVPTLNETGKIDHLILILMEQNQSLGAIAQQLAAQFPQRFPTHQVALTHVSELSQRYSES
jgi:protein arginine N-methyltransferase 1